MFRSRKAFLSVIIITQNMFQSSKFGVTIRKNCDYFVLFGSFGDALNIRHLNQAFFDEKKLQKAFQLLSNTSKKRYLVYILIDKHSRSPFPDTLRLRNDIFNSAYPIFFL